MKTTILLTGSNGQIGSELKRLLSNLGEVVALDRTQLDLSNSDSIRKRMNEIRPQLVVNSAAYTAVDQAESNEVTARAINAEAPAVIAEEAKRIGAVLVHYSTDYVFDGLKRSPYVESDRVNPLNVYGWTKLAGEQAIRDVGVPHLILRTSWVYATRGKNFLLTILRLASQREELRIVKDQIGAPTWSREVAGATVRVISEFLRGGTSTSWGNKGGTFHVTAGGETTWYDFAEAILEEAFASVQSAAWLEAATGGRPLIARRVVPVTTSEYPTPARRPSYSILSNSRLTDAFGIALPHWREQLKASFRSANS
jgi:dTDP-4-dehydrorhamnose reductase